ncbi:MAG: NAD(P)H-binding protein [Deltaproteobacteria bacterium]|nr:NAD(P)H-binding protein [Deltaproteobacteria bacterium]
MAGKILIAGGSGFIGSTIASALWKAERDVAVLSRHPNDARARLAGIEIDYVRGDVREPKSLSKALKGIETIISCVQFPNHPVENPRKGYTYEKIDGEGTRNLVEAAREAGGVKRFIYLSGAGVRQGRPRLAHEPWFRAKLMAEHAVIESGVAYTIFRPSWVYGRDDRSLNRFVDFARTMPFVPVIGDGDNRVQPLFIMDLVRYVIAAIDSPRARNRIYELGGPETLSMNEIVRTILKTLGKDKRIVHHPKWFMKLASLPMQALKAPPLSPQAIEFITMEELVDNREALADLELPLTRLADALATYLTPVPGGP